MAIYKTVASKATPSKGIDYIMDKDKMESWAVVNMDPTDNITRQMKDTQALWKKAQDFDNRKYYHTKISFAPEDRSENGGPLTPDTAVRFGMEFCQRAKAFSNTENAISVQGDGTARHLHIISNAVGLDGKMLDIRDREYRQLKDLCQTMCEEYGLTPIDWRQATRDKREREKEGDIDRKDTETLTRAEIGIRERHGQPEAHKLEAGTKSPYSWKDELRAVIDWAKESAQNVRDFVALLKEYGVETPRNTSNTISYQHPNQGKPIRGDKLGPDYTKGAIVAAIERNRGGKPLPDGERQNFGTLVAGAAQERQEKEKTQTKHKGKTKEKER